MSAPDRPPVDFAIHGVVNVRFVDAPEAFTKRFAAQWAPCLASPRDPAPDVSVRFADLSPAALLHVGQRWAAARDDDFFVLDEVEGTVIARMPMADLGKPCEIVCRHGTASVPFLVEAICFAFLRKGYIPLHASAFVHEGSGVVVMGWPKGGKTGALLAFMSRGARFVGDEWVMLSRDGRSVLGLPLPVSVSEWQLPHLPPGMTDIGLQRRLLLWALRRVESFDALLAVSPLARSTPAKLLHKSVPALRRQRKVTRPPAAWFGDDIGPLTASADRFFLLMSHQADDTQVQPVDAGRLAMSMGYAGEHEWRPLLDRYRAFKFVFPDRSNPLLENLDAHVGEPLAGALAGKRAYRVLHPYGGPLDALFAAMSPHCRR